jgi:tetrahydromethanopterin S-methyltransferase subunit F
MNDVRATITGRDAPLVRTSLRTSPAAAIAGILFSVLLIVSLWLLRRR